MCLCGVNIKAVNFEQYSFFPHFNFSQVGDNQCLLQSLKDSPYFAGYADKATLWETRLAELDEYLHNMNQIQRRWVYLEPIFGHGALPKEQARFKRVDGEFRSIMMDVNKDTRILSLLNHTGLKQTLVTLLDQLGRCQKALNEFLEVSTGGIKFSILSNLSLLPWEFKRDDGRLMYHFLFFYYL